jgi:hypothetical protein
VGEGRAPRADKLRGPNRGVGSRLFLVGRKIGEGRMTITESRPNELIRAKLDFVRPFAGTNTVEFTFRSEGDGI